MVTFSLSIPHYSTNQDVLTPGVRTVSVTGEGVGVGFGITIHFPFNLFYVKMGTGPPTSHAAIMLHKHMSVRGKR